MSDLISRYGIDSVKYMQITLERQTQFSNVISPVSRTTKPLNEQILEAKKSAGSSPAIDRP